MYYKALCPPSQTAQNSVVTVRTQKHQLEAKRQNITVKWNLDDKLNISSVNQFTSSVNPGMREFSYAH